MKIRLKKIIKLNPNFDKAYYNLGLIYLNVDKDLDRAKLNFEEALKLTNIHGAWFKHHPRRKLQAASIKPQASKAPSHKPQAPSSKRQATSRKRQAQ